MFCRAAVRKASGTGYSSFRLAQWLQVVSPPQPLRRRSAPLLVAGAINIRRGKAAVSLARVCDKVVSLFGLWLRAATMRSLLKRAKEVSCISFSCLIKTYQIKSLLKRPRQWKKSLGVKCKENQPPKIILYQSNEQGNRRNLKSPWQHSVFNKVSIC